MVTSTAKQRAENSRVVVVHFNNKLYYHYVETPEDEAKLMGVVIARYKTSRYLKNEKAIQDLHKGQLKK